MKANKDAKSKARRTLSIPEDDIPVYRYYNDSAVGLKLLLDLAKDDPEFIERLRRVSIFIMALACAPTAPNLESQLAKPQAMLQIKAPEMPPPENGEPLYQTNFNICTVVFDFLYEEAAKGNVQAYRFLSKVAHKAERFACKLTEGAAQPTRSAA